MKIPVDSLRCHWHLECESRSLVSECRAHFWVLEQNPCAVAAQMTRDWGVMRAGVAAIPTPLRGL